MSILKSKVFWAFSGTAGSIATALAYDKFEAQKIRQSFIEEAREYGQVSFKEGDHERKVSLLVFAENSEAAKEHKSVFQKYSVDLLTKAGVDYQWLEYIGSNMDKRYYELKKEKEIKEIPDGELPAAEEQQASKPRIFTPESFICPMAQSWFSGKSEEALKDEIEAQVKSEFVVKPVHPAFFSDGIIAMNPGTFRSLLWAYNNVAVRGEKVKTEPSLGMINCEFPSAFLKRIYYKFNTRYIADVVGRETMAVIRDRKELIEVSKVLPSEESEIHSKVKVQIYK